MEEKAGSGDSGLGDSAGCCLAQEPSAWTRHRVGSWEVAKGEGTHRWLCQARLHSLDSSAGPGLPVAHGGGEWALPLPLPVVGATMQSPKPRPFESQSLAVGPEH